MPGILVVDDEEPSVVLVSAALSSWGYEAYFTRNPNQVQDLVQQRQPDLIILDYMMPEASGAQVIQRLRTISAGAQIPIILLSGAPLDLIKYNLAGQPDVHIMPKPFDFPKLKTIVEGMLRERAKDRPDDSGITILK